MVSFDRRAARSDGTTSIRTASGVSWSKPASPSRLPSTRRTFQPGRASPRGRTVPLKLCTRPSALTNVPALSVNGTIGRIASAYSSAPLRYGENAITVSACESARTVATGSAVSYSGSTFHSR